MAEKVESGDYLLDHEIEEAKKKGYDEESFESGWRIGYSSACSLFKDREAPPARTVEETVTPAPGEQTVILRPGETAIMPGSVTGTRSVGTGIALKIVQAIKESGWDLNTMMVFWLVLVSSLIVLSFGLKLVFGVELLAQGVAGFWSWFIQPG